MDSHREVALGVDLGGTKLQVALVDREGLVLASKRVATDVQGGPWAVRSQIVEAARESMAQGQAEGFPLGIGLGVAGQIESETGRVLFGPNLGWKDVPLGAWIREELGFPVMVTNDVRAAAFGEWKFGAGRGVQDLVCLFVGTGIGGGIVAGGRLLHGASNSAGELGHLVVEVSGPACDCGGRGCLEALAGGRALAREARRAVQAYPAAGARLLGMAGGNLEGITAKILIQAARGGDRLARDILAKAKEALVAGLVSIVHGFNPGRVVLGGGIVEGMDELVEELEERLKARAMKAATRGLELVRAELGGVAGAVGAAAMVLAEEGLPSAVSSKGLEV